MIGILIGSAIAMGSPSPVKPIVVTPDIADPGKISVALTVTGTTAQVSRITRLTKVVEKIINSEKFKTRVLGSYYKGKLQFYDTTLNNEQVYETIRRGNELKSGNDYRWDLSIGVKHSRCSTLGWTYPNIREFYFNSCGFDQRSDSGLAGTICHEYNHKLGFSHSVQYTKSREYSVPYAIGTICAELYKEFL